MRNYAYTAGEHPPQHIPYERALRNLRVLMFSHYINHLENTGTLEGHWTLMVHECLTIASTLGCFHRWQRQMEPGDRDKQEWAKVPVVNRGDFRYKYSTMLILMGSVQPPAYGHPKMQGYCFDNVYHQGQFIGDLPAWESHLTGRRTASASQISKTGKVETNKTEAQGSGPGPAKYRVTLKNRK